MKMVFIVTKIGVFKMKLPFRYKSYLFDVYFDDHYKLELFFSFRDYQKVTNMDQR